MIRGRIAQPLLAAIERAYLSFLRFRHKNSYGEFYRHFMNWRVLRDPQQAVGGLWDELGTLQFEFLKASGLLPSHRLLDIGCGSLRAGRFFIDYLAPGHYVGIDVSEGAIQAGKNILGNSLMRTKRPELHRCTNLRFDEFAPARFDFLLAQSVFTHAPFDTLRECLTHARRVLTTRGAFYFTIFEGPRHTYVSGIENFYFPLQDVIELGSATGWRVSSVADFVHPRGQVMLKATIDPTSPPK